MSALVASNNQQRRMAGQELGMPDSAETHVPVRCPSPQTTPAAAAITSIHYALSRRDQRPNNHRGRP
eukprot:scaffold21359_cov83-Skeletonema_dohrnii-CCMP3373.AAC.1